MLLKGSCHCGAVKFSLQSRTPYPYMRCYCSICRKTAGGGGYAINIMGEAKSFKVKGNENVSIYRARMGKGKKLPAPEKQVEVVLTPEMQVALLEHIEKRLREQSLFDVPADDRRVRPRGAPIARLR